MSERVNEGVELPEPARPVVVVVLAAGAGTRMRSSTAKVLHGFAGRSLVGHALAATDALAAAQTVVVVGHQADQVSAHLARIAPRADIVHQRQQNGTGHAVRVALQALPTDLEATVVVVPGDAPLLLPETLRRLVDIHHDHKAGATLLTSVVTDPAGYGRVVRTADGVRIVEHRDASAEQLLIAEVAAGVYAFDHLPLRAVIDGLPTDNAQGEQYLPDAVPLLSAAGYEVATVVADAAETAGVNDRVQLAAAHAVARERLLRSHLLAGVTLVDPATTWIDAGVDIEPDVVLWPGVHLRGITRIATGAEIGPDVTLIDSTIGADSRVVRSWCEGAELGAGCSVGPYAYLRPGARLADNSKVGTFVEVKNADIGPGSKVPHLSYVGDATIGAHTNIGAATVFVNYDGVSKHRSRIGDHARTGADNMFVAPVEVGDGAYTAAGSVIDRDVPPGALGVGRARQRNIEGWVARRRAGTESAAAAHRSAASAGSASTGSEPAAVEPAGTEPTGTQAAGRPTDDRSAS